MGLPRRPPALRSGRCPAHLIFGHVAVEDVPRHVQVDRPRSGPEGVTEGCFHQFGDAPSIVATIGPARDRSEQRYLVGFLEGPHAPLGDGACPPNGHDGSRIHKCVGYPGDEVRRAGTAAGHADRRLAPEATVGDGHHGGCLFVAGIDHPDLLPQAGVLAIDHGPAHQEENHFHPMVFQTACQDLVPGHRASLRSRLARPVGPTPLSRARGVLRIPRDCAGRGEAPPRSARANTPS